LVLFGLIRPNRDFSKGYERKIRNNVLPTQLASRIVAKRLFLEAAWMGWLDSDEGKSIEKRYHFILRFASFFVAAGSARARFPQ
jgi:hypothetical protein